MLEDSNPSRLDVNSLMAEECVRYAVEVCERIVEEQRFTLIRLLII